MRVPALTSLSPEAGDQTSRIRPRNGAEALLETLVECGVDTLFGYPGGAALPLYDALFNEPRLRHVLVRHEQAAVHAAEGYARSTGRVGVVLVMPAVRCSAAVAASSTPGRGLARRSPNLYAASMRPAH